ncbi:aspartate-semialdehyde dehydrogenase [Roseomonas elaeocarpi]|uniref:Aspartate-semialdehyde dehydrogenase n=1 Tax=Roseomonas elaeocarpi TaxID=907779 RepID=A0ABV6JNY4_9PROT
MSDILDLDAAAPRDTQEAPDTGAFRRIEAAAPRVAIVGATGAVGEALLDCLAARRFPIGELRLLASPRSAGRTLPFRGKEVAVEALTERSFEGVDLALFSAGSGISKRYAAAAVQAGAVVVDNSSAFRMDPDVPLVVPEVNARAIEAHRGIIANPNCVAAIATVALAPLHRAHPIRRLTMATYQAASGAGAAAMEELRQSTAAYLRGEAFEPKVLPHPYAFNLFSHNAEMDPESGYNGEELKVVAETRRILDVPELPVSITCIRVPVLRAHAMALSVEFDAPVAVEEARALLEGAPGLRLVDDRARNHFPMPSEASGADDVLVGRLRRDLGDPSGRTLALFVAGDQLLKGAALNAVQIAERLLRR